MEELKDIYYTVKQTATLLSVNKPLIFKMISSGKLPAMNLGSGKRNIYRIKYEDISSLITKQKEDGHQGPSKN